MDVVTVYNTKMGKHETKGGSTMIPTAIRNTFPDAAHDFFIIAGPCVLEDEKTTLTIADTLARIRDDLKVPIVFKASYDKANRTSIRSFRGPGITAGLELLATVRQQTGLPILSDVHTTDEVTPAAAVLDILQIPAFLCRQTDFIQAVARAGKPVNIKKGQFLAPWDMAPVIQKIESTGNHDIFLTERGAAFGYNNLVVDFRSIPIMQAFGHPVVFDATHSVQLPGGQGTASGGQREYAPVLGRAAVAAGADGIFMEIHPDPDTALCDGPNSLPLDTVHPFIKDLLAIRSIVQKETH